ncbi:hypothetical protein N9Y25_04300 [Candidatus Pelagibacter bacterium]|nr:hypothetical protein [Candidatus Pelagibacter bacterium]MDB2709336.1 hypothetical protein [Candidatus Pelagibacter bacterium]
MKKNKCIIHIGAHKTGTTFLQRNLYLNRSIIKNNSNFVIIKPSEEPSYLKARKFFRKEIFNPSPNYELYIESFNKLFSKYENKDLIISDEAFLGHSALHRSKSLYPQFNDVINSIKNIFKNYEIKIILTTRKIPSFIVSCYYQSIKEGYGIEFNDFFQSLDLYHFSWKKILEKSSLKINILPYEIILKDQKNFFFEFAKLLELDSNTISKININEKPTNRSMSYYDALFLIKSKKFFEESLGSKKTYNLFCKFIHQTNQNNKKEEKISLINSSSLTILDNLYSDEYAEILKPFNEFIQ